MPRLQTITEDDCEDIRQKTEAKIRTETQNLRGHSAETGAKARKKQTCARTRSKNKGQALKRTQTFGLGIRQKLKPRVEKKNENLGALRSVIENPTKHKEKHVWQGHSAKTKAKT